MIHLRIHSIVWQKYSFKEFIHSKIIKKYSFKEFIHSKKIHNYSFKEFIHSRKSKIIHSKKIFIQVKNRLSPRANCTPTTRIWKNWQTWKKEDHHCSLAPITKDNKSIRDMMQIQYTTIQACPIHTYHVAWSIVATFC